MAVPLNVQQPETSPSDSVSQLFELAAVPLCHKEFAKPHEPDLQAPASRTTLNSAWTSAQMKK